MKKEEFILSFKEEERDLAIKVYEKYELAFKRDIVTFTNEFVTPNIWLEFLSRVENQTLQINTYGIFENSERKVISFNNIYDVEFPIRLLKVTNKSKFKILEHKDYLGALLSLGINRNKIGDILVKGNCAYVPIMEDISDYVVCNLNQVGRTPVEVSNFDLLEELPATDMEESIINVSSVRLDGVVSKIINLSRAKSNEIIDRGNVLVNYRSTRDKSLNLKENDRVTIRGFGKFLVGGIVGNTKSNRLKLTIKKYK